VPFLVESWKAIVALNGEPAAPRSEIVSLAAATQQSGSSQAVVWNILKSFLEG
jgi:hypothetical protein